MTVHSLSEARRNKSQMSAVDKSELHQQIRKLTEQLIDLRKDHDELKKLVDRLLKSLRR